MLVHCHMNGCKPFKFDMSPHFVHLMLRLHLLMRLTVIICFLSFFQQYKVLSRHRICSLSFIFSLSVSLFTYIYCRSFYVQHSHRASFMTSLFDIKLNSVADRRSGVFHGFHSHSLVLSLTHWSESAFVCLLSKYSILVVLAYARFRQCL